MRIFTAILFLVVLVAVAAAVWYFVAPPKTSPSQSLGTITGETLYPSEGVPALTVCVQSVVDTSNISCTDVPGQEIGQRALPRFSLSVKPGTYWLYAELADPAGLGIDESYKAYYTEFVRCGLTVECKDHTKIEISVEPGETIENIILGDWYNN